MPAKGKPSKQNRTVDALIKKGDGGISWEETRRVVATLIYRGKNGTNQVPSLACKRHGRSTFTPGREEKKGLRDEKKSRDPFLEGRRALPNCQPTILVDNQHTPYGGELGKAIFRMPAGGRQDPIKRKKKKFKPEESKVRPGNSAINGGDDTPAR